MNVCRGNRNTCYGFCKLLESNLNYRFELTQQGKEAVRQWLYEATLTRKDLLDNYETVEHTTLPTCDDICTELNNCEINDGLYETCWGITDDSDLWLSLECGKDFQPIKIDE